MELPDDTAVDKGASLSKNKSLQNTGEIEVIRKGLEQAEAPAEILKYIKGYSEDDVPLIYSGESHDATCGGGDNEGKDYLRPVKSSLMVGMKAPIYERASEYDDQNPNVIVQWRGMEFTDAKGGNRGITREEVEQIRPGVYITREYKGVSGLGKFDGRLVEIGIQVESGEFHPGSRYPHRKEYSNTSFYRGKNGEWRSFDFSSTTILNGVEELKAFHLTEIRLEKNLLTSGIKEAPLLPEIVRQTEAEETKLRLLVKDNPEIIDKIRDYSERIYEMSISQLENPGLLKNTIEMLNNGVFHYPERVFIGGRLVSALPDRQKFSLAQLIAKEGLPRFKQWYEDKRLNGLFTGENLRSRIIDKNLYHFVQFWNIHNKGKFPEPDWQGLRNLLRD
jgi:hypothetical protein